MTAKWRKKHKTPIPGARSPFPLPAVIATWPFGLPAVRRAGEILAHGGDLLDAVEQGIHTAELDPKVRSVGLGGLPNADGVVELDAAIMDGRTHRAGAVAALRDIATPISVARCVMEKTWHVMLAGEAAKRFALAQGFCEENLLTDKARRKWQEWRKKQFCAGIPAGERARGQIVSVPPGFLPLVARSRTGTSAPYSSHDTIGLIALGAHGDIAVGCSTSGLAFKAAGRVGDSPILGSGLYADNDVGGAVATGMGEEIMKSCCSHLAVEFMRDGDPPMAACRKVIARVLAKSPQNKKIMIAVLAMDQRGRIGAAASRKGFSYAIWQNGKSRLLKQ